MTGVALSRLSLLAAILAAPLLTPLPLGAQLVVLGAGVAILGLPHGALDHWLGRDLLAPCFGLAWPAVFAALYLGLSGAVLAAWLAAPGAALVGFLLLSVLHFGIGDAENQPPSTAEVLARGGLVVALPMLVHPAETAALFGWLTGDAANAGAAVAAVRWPVAVLWAGTVAATFAIRPARGMVIELVLLTATFALLPPLLAFAVYFCALHSPRHFADLAASRGEPLARILVAAVPLTVATLLLAAVGAWLLRAEPPEVAALQVVFWGLSALTVPHMLLTALTTRPFHRPR